MEKEEEYRQWIEKACKWLEENVWEMTGVDYSALSDSFCKAMEEIYDHRYTEHENT